MSALLELDGVTAGYGGGDVLHELDLSIEEGGITCVVGPNGAGKSTILRADQRTDQAAPRRACAFAASRSPA